MPKALHDRLARQASEPAAKRRRRGLKPITDRQAYIYGTMRQIQQRRGKG